MEACAMKLPENYLYLCKDCTNWQCFHFDKVFEMNPVTKVGIPPPSIRCKKCGSSMVLLPFNKEETNE